MKSFTILLLSLVLSFPLCAQRIQRCENGCYGLAVKKSNGNIKWLAKPKYTRIETAPYGAYLVCDQRGKWGAMSSGGTIIVECAYPSLDAAEEAYTYKVNPDKKNFASNKSGMSASTHNDFTLTRNYSQYIKGYVERKINEWQKKGEFEKTSDYQRRVTNQARNRLIAEYTREICEECLSKVQDKELRMILKEYDADNETFLITCPLGEIVVPVPIAAAPKFKAEWSKITSSNTYDLVDGRIRLKSTTFYLNGKIVATFSDNSQALYAQSNIQYNFDPVEVDLGSASDTSGPSIVRNNISVGKADIDIDIPSNKTAASNTFALIIANENYRDEEPVAFAKNDGASVGQYFRMTLGIPATNIHLVNNATKNDIIRELDWLKSVSSAYGNDIDVYVYYVGHGAPDDADASAYLVPSDGTSKNPKTLYAVNEFYDELASATFGRKIVFLDACFSGSLRGNGMLTASRGVALKAKTPNPKNKMIVFSAAQGNETAYPYIEKNHGLFTYFLLKKLQATKGEATLGQLSDYIADEVSRHSVVVNAKPQTPVTTFSPDLGNDWKSLKLK